jgi:hypothetical protein
MSFVATKHETPHGKVPLDYALWVRDITSSKFAETIGVSLTTMSAYRRGMRPGPKMRAKIAGELGTTEGMLWPEVPVA